MDEIEKNNPEAFIHTDDKKAICIKCNGIKEWTLPYRYSTPQSFKNGYWIYKHTDRKCKHIWRKLENEGGIPPRRKQRGILP